MLHLHLPILNICTLCYKKYLTCLISVYLIFLISKSLWKENCYIVRLRISLKTTILDYCHIAFSVLLCSVESMYKTATS